MAKKPKRKVSIQVATSDEQVSAMFGATPTPTRDDNVADRLHQAKAVRRSATDEGDDRYPGPRVDWKHTGATKAAQMVKDAKEKQKEVEDAFGDNTPATPASVVVEDDIPYVNTDDHIPQGFSRVQVPSGCLFYNFKSLGIRPLTPKELILVTGASQAADSVGLHDVLDGTITQDIRKLWWADYIYLLIWHRLNSYVKVPYNIKWASIYGNERTDELRVSSLGQTVLKITPQEYEEYKSLGFHAPTVKDAEQMNSRKFTTEEWRLWLRAQYIAGDSIDDRLAAVCDLDVDALIKLKSFSAALNDVGVMEYIQVADVDMPNDVPAAVANLAIKIETFSEIVDPQNGLTADEQRPILKKLEDAVSEYKKLTALIDSNKLGEAEPMLETIQLTVQELTFLPRL